MGQKELKMLISINNTSKCYLWDVSSQFSGKGGHTSLIIFLNSKVWLLHTITKLKAPREWKRPLNECVGKYSKWRKSQADWKLTEVKQIYFFIGKTKCGLAGREAGNTGTSDCNSFLLDEGIRTSCRMSVEAQLLSDGYLVHPPEMICQKLNLALPFTLWAWALPTFTWGGRGRWEGPEEMHFGGSSPSTTRCVLHLHLPVTCKGSLYVLEPCVVTKWGVVSRLERRRVIWY